MSQHIHYGDWTISWSKDAPERFKFWIDTNISIPEQHQIELFSLFVKYFDTPEMGIYRCKRIIDLIAFYQREMITRVTTEYLDSLKPPVPVVEKPLVNQEDCDKIPF